MLRMSQITSGPSPVSDTTSASRSPPETQLQGPFYPPGSMGSVGSSDALVTRPLSLENQAPRACEKCRASKRKCDKKLPFCDRCIRLNAKCHYIQEPMVNNPNIHGTQVVLFQSALSSDILLRGTEPLEGITPAQILGLINYDTNRGGPPIDWQYAINLFFTCIHSWYAVVHPTLFFQQLSNLNLSATTGSASPADSNLSPYSSGAADQQVPTRKPAPDHQAISEFQAKEVALLILSMYLTLRMRLTDAGEQYMFDEAYRSAKRIWSLLTTPYEGGPSPSIELVQCGALLALYEYGHGAFESAYRTLNHISPLVRYLGIKPGYLADGQMDVDEATMSMEDKQAGCLWWGMFILEQFIHQDESTRHLPFIFESPNPRTLLPDTPPMTPNLSSMNDLDPNLANTPPPSSSTQSIMTGLPIGAAKLGSFQTSAKVSSILHRALLIDQERRMRPGEMPLVQTYKDLDNEVRRSTQEMLSQTPVDWELTLDCFAMLISTLFVLYIPYLPILERTPGPMIESNMELSTALAALRFACKMSTDISCKINYDYETSPRSPAILSAPAGATCYLVISVFTVLGRIFPSEHSQCQQMIAEKFESLWLFSFRWGIAEKMMRQLEQRAGLDRNHYLKNVKNSSISPPVRDASYEILTERKYGSGQ
ncbi:hypothetical protein F5Y15DRAFT_410552 [Xylariaceae sp. FL0016]|nr:hypothetical protein F5Y15DRAFT_410552 [Xylariaceae sp. FL0016]